MSEPDRFRLVADHSGHDYVIPVERGEEWDEFLAIPEGDPQSWTVPRWALRVDGNLTFTDPQS
jgi:hypothetical protein